MDEDFIGSFDGTITLFTDEEKEEEEVAVDVFVVATAPLDLEKLDPIFLEMAVVFLYGLIAEEGFADDFSGLF